MRPTLPALLAALLVAATAAGCSAQTSARGAGTETDAAFGARVRAYLLRHPEVLGEALQKLEDQHAAQAAATARSSIAAHVAALDHDARDPVGGDPHGARTLVEFFDYRCPYCKVAAPKLPAFLKAHPDVRLVYKEFPILSPESETAARYALAADRQGKYLPVHQALMAAPQLSDAVIQDVLRANGVDLARAKADAEGPEIRRHIADDRALAEVIGANGTPSFITGDTLSAGWLPEELDIALKSPVPGHAIVRDTR